MLQVTSSTLVSFIEWKSKVAELRHVSWNGFTQWRSCATFLLHKFCTAFENGVSYALFHEIGCWSKRSVPVYGTLPHNVCTKLVWVTGRPFKWQAKEVASVDALLHNLSAPKMSRQSCHVTTQVNSSRGIPSIILAHQHVIVTDGLRICEL